MSGPRWRKIGLLVICFIFLPCILNVFGGEDLDSTPLDSADWWSLRPLSKPKLPNVIGDDWVRNSVDAFVLAKQEHAGLKPAPEADKKVYLRRVSFDLIGLPPTPHELRAFEEDESEDAFAKVVDRLLASPRYGERWARHWMDLVHFAETHGHDQDRIRTNAWPYRDYLIQSFNEDKPYGRFIEEQIAGDIFHPKDPAATVAMGFLATGPWDESSLRDIRDDSIDRHIARYIDRDDIVMTTMTTFTSTTVHCARCHDHKFDPISQKEYYGLQAVFAATDKANRRYDLDPEIHMLRQSLLKQKADLEMKPNDVIDRLLSSSLQTDVSAWEKSLAEEDARWTVLDPDSFSASDGVVLTKLDDQSLVSGGKRPERSRYEVAASTTLDGITAIRLEVFADERFPKSGPGRQDNGNFHLSEFTVRVASEIRNEKFSDSDHVALTKPTADFNQDGWGIEKAMDGKTNTAWGIFPSVGQSHTAIFQTVENIQLDGNSKLHFHLDQNHGEGHLIGRFRLSVTSTPRPVKVRSLPSEIVSILAKENPERTREDSVELAVFYRGMRIEEQLRNLPQPLTVYAGASDFIADGSFKPARTPRPVHLLRRGNINRPGLLAVPGALSCVPALESPFRLEDTSNEGERRAALAKWISSPENPLTWRSIVNRIWHHHFGRGIVGTPNDFGQMGSKPTHPKLLDWLAIRLMESGGSLKELHRIIVLSAVYRQSTRSDSEFANVDADNLLLWRMNRTRLDAESVRDAVLQISGKIDLRMGGPSARHFALSPGIHVTPVVDYLKFDIDSPHARRRSVYRFLFRTLPDPFMDVLDCADSSQLTAKRNSSVTPLQALSMLNNPFMVRHSEHLATRVSKEEITIKNQVGILWQLAVGRDPSANESKLLTEYAAAHGLANACRIVFNSNEFMFVN